MLSTFNIMLSELPLARIFLYVMSSNGSASLLAQQAWTNLKTQLLEIQKVKDKTDALISRINKGHSKVQNREQSQELFTIKAGLRLQEIYNNLLAQSEQERMYLVAYVVLQNN